MLEWDDGKRKWISFGAPLRDSSNRNVEEVNIFRYTCVCIRSLINVSDLDGSRFIDVFIKA